MSCINLFELKSVINSEIFLILILKHIIVMIENLFFYTNALLMEILILLYSFSLLLSKIFI